MSVQPSPSNLRILPRAAGPGLSRHPDPTSSAGAVFNTWRQPAFGMPKISRCSLRAESARLSVWPWGRSRCRRPSAPSPTEHRQGSVSCTSGYVSEPFLSTLNVSDPDTPLLYSWSTSGSCSIVRANTTGNFQAEAWIQRGSGSGTCTVRAQVTDYYNATRTISSSCQVRTPPLATVDGVCGCAALSCSSGTVDDQTPSEPSGWDSRPPPDGDGPWDPPHEWYCDGRNGGGWDYCVEGSSCPSPVSGSCSGTINRCSNGNAAGLTTISDPDETIYRWTCRGIAGGSNDSCEVIHSHPRPCDPTTDRVNGQCGPNFGDCTAGNYEPASNQSWVCRGICGGTDDECDSPDSNREDGACGPTLNNCAQGSYQSVSGPTWNCLGVNGGSNATGCAVIEHGVCGSPQGACYQGTSSGNTNPWTCQGANGGAGRHLYFRGMRRQQHHLRCRHPCQYRRVSPVALSGQQHRQQLGRCVLRGGPVRSRAGRLRSGHLLGQHQPLGLRGLGIDQLRR